MARSSNLLLVENMFSRLESIQHGGWIQTLVAQNFEENRAGKFLDVVLAYSHLFRHQPLSLQIPLRQYTYYLERQGERCYWLTELDK